MLTCPPGVPTASGRTHRPAAVTGTPYGRSREPGRARGRGAEGGGAGTAGCGGAGGTWRP
ncbi:hypothetical protein [Streptomyces coeruleoprunus]|uniref:hypothetical protein n=1 Tax=Streptomyces coeruleoprunus TaxID=285563 RepID=UPI0036D2B23B